jgi:branched-chain amino acid transport system substrate-binding protein
MKLSFTSFAFVLTASLVTSTPNTHAQSAEKPLEVKVGVLTDMNGPYADAVGKGSVLAAEMAIEDFKSINPSAGPIKLVSADHQNKPDIASNIARSWFEIEGVDMIVDLANSAVALAGGKIATRYDKVAMITGAGATVLFNEECSENVLTWTFSSYALAKSTARALQKQGNKSWYFITADYAGGHAFEKDASEEVRALGGSVLGSSRVPSGLSDFSSSILKAQSSGADVLGIANFGFDALNTIRQAKEFGFQNPIAGLLLFITDIHGLGLESAQGLYLTSSFYWDRDDQSRQWSKRFFARHARMPTMDQAGTYSAVLNYLSAVYRAKSKDRSAVLAEMRKAKIDDPFVRNGTLREDGLLVHDYFLFRVKKPSESKYPWDYYTWLDTVAGDQATLPAQESKCKLLKKG